VQSIDCQNGEAVRRKRSTGEGKDKELVMAIAFKKTTSTAG
jgi:hypothetical protein